MNTTNDTKPQPLSKAERSERIALALLLVFGAILMLVASRAAAEDRMPFSASRTDRFTATLGPRSTVRIENIAGDIVARPGKTFSAVASVSVASTTQKRADELLARTVIEQTQEDQAYSLETQWPATSREWRGHRTPSRLSDGRINVKFEVTIPPGLTAELKTVNGEVRVTDVDGDLDVSSVNGNVHIEGSRRSLRARTVNGRVEALAALLPAGSSVDCRTVNGAVNLTLPKDAKFDFSASTMSGGIFSTFALPARPEIGAMPVVRPGREKNKETSRAKSKETGREKETEIEREGSPRRVVIRGGDDGEDIAVDIQEIQREIEQSMREVEIAVRRGLESTREAQIFTLMPGREYTGSVGQGGARVHASTLSGSITVLAAGSREADAKPLVSTRRSFTYPRMRVVQIPEPPEAPEPPEPVIAPARPLVHPQTVTLVRPRMPKLLSGEEEDIERGDITGDFLSTTAGSGYRIGHVSGSVRILTRNGEIHVGSAGLTADLKTYGGEIKIGPVGGDFRALTMAGDVQAGVVAGSATAETSGGDIRIDGVKGALEARTGGGDVIVPSVGGTVDVQTGGGDVRLGLTVKQASIAVRNGGGDVILTLPADFRGDFDLLVSDASPEETTIRSEFPGISVTRRSGSQQASGSVNGGGPKVVVRTSSGTIRIRKG